MPELSLGEVFTLLQTQIKNVGDGLTQRMDRLEAQNSREHSAVRTDFQELGSEMRQVASSAAAAKALSEANAHEIAEHKSWHRDQEKFADGVESEHSRIEDQTKRLKDTVVDVTKDVVKVTAIAAAGAALALLKGHL